MTEIIIGSRRPRRRVRRGSVIAVFVVAALAFFVGRYAFGRVVAYVTPAGDADKSALSVIEEAGEDRLATESSRLSHRGALPVLRLVGKPRTLGVDHGRLIGSSLDSISRTGESSFRSTVGDSGWLVSLFGSAPLRWKLRLLDDSIPGHQLVEAYGMAEGASQSGYDADYDRVLEQQVVFDVGSADPASDPQATRQIARSLTFVSSTSGQSGGRLFVGRTLSLPGFSDGGAAIAAAPLVTFYRPDGVIPFASVGYPGLVGVLSGINRDGLIVMVHPSRSDDVALDRVAQPVTLIARDILENASSLAEAQAVLEATTPLGAAAFVVVDTRSRKVAVLERSPDRFAARTTSWPVVVGDTLDTDLFADDAEVDRIRRRSSSTERVARLRALSRTRPPNAAADAVNLLRDTGDDGSRGADDPSAVHAMVIDSTAQVLFVSAGPGTGGTYYAFDLRHELGAAGDRPAPPADIPEAPAASRDAARAETAALRHDREAIRLRKAGDKRLATEAEMRSRLLRPAGPNVPPPE